MELEALFTEFAKLTEASKTLEAIDKFYAVEYIQYENSDDPIIGKDTNRAKEVENIAGVHHFKIQFDKVVVDENQQIVWGEMGIRFDNKKFGPLKMTEAFFQQWKEGKLTEQRFYYKEIQKA